MSKGNQYAKKTLSARVATFMYHEVTDDPTQSGFPRKSALPYKHGTLEFERHLEQIRQSSITPNLAHLIDFSLPQRNIMLTFDDGGKSAMYIADQIEKLSWKGHFFITTSMISSRCFLSKRDIIDLDSRGHVIGSHSHTHPDIFYNLSRQIMIEEWQISCDKLSQIIRKPVNMASIPGGDMNMLSQMTASLTGIKYLFTSEPTLTPWLTGELICIGRVCPKRGASLKVVRDFVQFRGFRKQLVIRKTKQLIKRALSSLYAWRMNRSRR